MDRVTAVILAGTLRPSPLREAIDAPALCLPLAAELPLLTAWRETLGRAGADDVRIVVNNEADVEAVGQVAGRRRREIRIIAEPSAWRGTAGILQDVTDDLDQDDPIVVVEAASLPAPSLEPLLEALEPSDAGVVGLAGDDEPAGVFVFRRVALEGRVAGVGYHDLKEQLMPALHRDGLAVRTARVASQVLRIRDRRTYLKAVRTYLARQEGAPFVDAAPQASVSGSAITDGYCIVQPGAVVEDGAVLHESVVLSGATISGGAVVTRSVVGPKATIAPRERVVRQIIVNGEAEPRVRIEPRVARTVR